MSHVYADELSGSGQQLTVELSYYTWHITTHHGIYETTTCPSYEVYGIVLDKYGTIEAEVTLPWHQVVKVTRVERLSVSTGTTLKAVTNSSEE